MLNDESLFTIHAGLAPGELFLQPTKTERGGLTVLPAARWASVFGVMSEGEQHLLIRRQTRRIGGIEEVVDEVLCSFDDADEARAAMDEITAVLMRTDDEISGPGEAFPVTSFPARPAAPISRGWWWALAIAAGVGLMAIGQNLIHQSPAQAEPLAGASVPKGAVALPANDGANGRVGGPVGLGEGLRPAGAPASPAPADPAPAAGVVVKPAAEPGEPNRRPIASPGDAFMQQAGGEDSSQR